MKDIIESRRKRCIDICDTLKKTYEAKNHDYGNSFHETFVKYGPVSALVRMEDKLNRAKTLLNGSFDKQVKDESVFDTLLDYANYAIMTVAELHMGNYDYTYSETIKAMTENFEHYDDSLIDRGVEQYNLSDILAYHRKIQLIVNPDTIKIVRDYDFEMLTIVTILFYVKIEEICGNQDDDSDRVATYISHPAIYEQLSEECLELISELSHLGQSASKCARCLREENPPRISFEEAEKKVREEFTDVVVTASELGIHADKDVFEQKRSRWLNCVKNTNSQKI